MTILLVGTGGDFATIQEAVDAASRRRHDRRRRAAPMSSRSSGRRYRQSHHRGRRRRSQVTIQAPADVVETGRSSSDREVARRPHRREQHSTSSSRASTSTAPAAATRSTKAAAPGQANFYGIFYRNASGALNEVDITGVRDPYPGGTEPGGEPTRERRPARRRPRQVDNDSLMAFTDDRRLDQRLPEERHQLQPRRPRHQRRRRRRQRRDLADRPERLPADQFDRHHLGQPIFGHRLYRRRRRRDRHSCLRQHRCRDHRQHHHRRQRDTQPQRRGRRDLCDQQWRGPGQRRRDSGNTISYADVGIGIYGNVQPNGILVENNRYHQRRHDRDLRRRRRSRSHRPR